MTANTIRGVVRIVNTNVKPSTGVNTNVNSRTGVSAKPASVLSVVN